MLISYCFLIREEKYSSLILFLVIMKKDFFEIRLLNQHIGKVKAGNLFGDIINRSAVEETNRIISNHKVANAFKIRKITFLGFDYCLKLESFVIILQQAADCFDFDNGAVFDDGNAVAKLLNLTQNMRGEKNGSAFFVFLFFLHGKARGVTLSEL